MRWLLLICIVLLTGLLATLPFASTQDVPSPTPAGPTATPLPGSIGPGQYPAAVNPLTGQMVNDPTILERRPLAIKVSNAPAIVRPQAGLAKADLVYEHYVEGRLTRFTAIFYTHTPPFVGSVRSARLIDLEIPLMYDALFAFSGASGPIVERIKASELADRAFLNSGEPLFYRDADIEIPHNLFAVPESIWAQAPGERPDLSGMVFVDTPPPGAISAASTIIVNYGPVAAEWTYHSGQYNRAVNGEPHVDAIDGQPIRAANVVIIWTHHQEDVTVVENEWQGNKTYSIEMQIWTLGPVTLFRDGRRYDGHWHRWDKADMLTFWADDTMTERLYLKPGVTWFQVVPLDFAGLVVTAPSG